MHSSTSSVSVISVLHQNFGTNIRSEMKIKSKTRFSNRVILIIENFHKEYGKAYIILYTALVRKSRKFITYSEPTIPTYISTQIIEK